MPRSPAGLASSLRPRQDGPRRKRSAPVPIIEAALCVRPCCHFLRLKDPVHFRVARSSELRDLSTFNRSEAVYCVQGRPRQVWRGYTAADPLAIWSNSRSWLVAVYVPSRGRTLSREELARGWRGFERGMKLFLDMSVLPVAITNWPAMMVALEIVRLDRRRRVVEFQYLEGSPSFGRQVLEFRCRAGEPGVTEITHRTWYRSTSRLVEALYPYYHDRMLEVMHSGFQEEVERQRRRRE